MKISVIKTEVMQVIKQGKVSVKTSVEVRGVNKHNCVNVGCEKFSLTHMDASATRTGVNAVTTTYYLVYNLLNVCGELGSTKCEFLMRWKDCGPETDECRSHKDIDPELINDFFTQTTYTTTLGLSKGVPTVTCRVRTSSVSVCTCGDVTTFPWNKV